MKNIPLEFYLLERGRDLLDYLLFPNYRYFFLDKLNFIFIIKKKKDIYIRSSFEYFSNILLECSRRMKYFFFVSRLIRDGYLVMYYKTTRVIIVGEKSVPRAVSKYNYI